MSKKSMKSKSLVLVGVALLCGNSFSVQAKTSEMYAEKQVVTLEEAQGVKYGVSDETDYTNLFKCDYSVNISGTTKTFKDLGIKKEDYTSVKVEDLKVKVENELYYLKSAYDYIVAFGCGYENEKFYTYSNKEVTLVEFDYYVYSLIKAYIQKGGSTANELARNYNELIGVRECILNFNLVSSDFREKQIQVLADTYWTRDVKYDKFRI